MLILGRAEPKGTLESPKGHTALWKRPSKNPWLELTSPHLLLPQFFMSLAALVVLIIHLFTKPYKKMYINVIEAAILLDLLMVTAAFLDPPSSSPVPQWFSIILLMLPYTYAVIFIGYKIAVRLWYVDWCVRECSSVVLVN